MMHRSDIEWTDYVWNPVTGCRHGCPYCYAKVQTRRFSGDVRLNMSSGKRWKDTDLFVLEEPFAARNDRSIPFPFGFDPTLHLYRLKNPQCRKVGSKVFVCSMADLFGDWVPDEWIEKVFAASEEAPQHIYLFLTKNPARYVALAKAGKLPKRDNMWYGTSIPTEDAEYFYAKGYHTFLSIEPLHSDFSGPGTLKTEWVIVGAETGRRKNKVIPQKEWVFNIMSACEHHQIPLFMKNSLAELMHGDFMQEYPEYLVPAKKLSEKQRERLLDRCGFCKKELPKKEMKAIMSRAGRGIQPSGEGYLCNDCLEVMREIFAREEPIVEEVLQNEKA